MLCSATLPSGRYSIRTRRRSLNAGISARVGVPAPPVKLGCLPDRDRGCCGPICSWHGDAASQDLAGGEEMTSLAAGMSTDGGADEFAEDEAARLVPEAETALHDAREPGVDAWSASAAEHRSDRGSRAGCQIQQAQQHQPFMRMIYRRDRTRIQGRGITRTVTTSDGVSLSVREYGSRDPAHTVVLLHGFCLTKGSWTIPIDHLLHQYGDSIRIISYDHRGHGDSAAAPMHTYRIDRLAADLADLLAALGVAGPLTLAGHSMGGMVALAYLGRPADQRPVQPHGLILVATAAGKLTERGRVGGNHQCHPSCDESWLSAGLTALQPVSDSEFHHSHDSGHQRWRGQAHPATACPRPGRRYPRGHARASARRQPHALG